MNKEIDYIYEDGDILVCHKPAGMATEGAGAGRMDLVSAVRNHLARKMKKNQKGRQSNLPPYIATINRLDAPVEGILVLAKNKKAASDLSQQIKNRTTKKYYYALCLGSLKEDKGTLSDILIRRGDTKLAQVISEDEKCTICDNVISLNTGEKVELIGGDAKNAELEYEVIARDDKTSLLRIHLITGRFHQIRAQLSSRNNPILGDDRYGNEESIALSRDRGISDICLAAYRFEFHHPGTKKDTIFEIVPHNTAIKEMLERSL